MLGRVAQHYEVHEMKVWVIIYYLHAKRAKSRPEKRNNIQDHPHRGVWDWQKLPDE
jgi:hypothetical protein